MGHVAGAQGRQGREGLEGNDEQAGSHRRVHAFQAIDRLLNLLHLRVKAEERGVCEVGSLLVCVNSAIRAEEKREE